MADILLTTSIDTNLKTELAQLQAQFDSLGGKTTLNLQKEINKTSKAIDTLSGRTSKSSALVGALTRRFLTVGIAMRAVSTILSGLSKGFGKVAENNIEFQKGLGELNKAFNDKDGFFQAFAPLISEFGEVLGDLAKALKAVTPLIKGYFSIFNNNRNVQEETNEVLIRIANNYRTVAQEIGEVEAKESSLFPLIMKDNQTFEDRLNTYKLINYEASEYYKNIREGTAPIIPPPRSDTSQFTRTEDEAKELSKQISELTKGVGNLAETTREALYPAFLSFTEVLKELGVINISQMFITDSPVLESILKDIQDANKLLKEYDGGIEAALGLQYKRIVKHFPDVSSKSISDMVENLTSLNETEKKLKEATEKISLAQEELNEALSADKDSPRTKRAKESVDELTKSIDDYRIVIKNLAAEQEIILGTSNAKRLIEVKELIKAYVELAGFQRAALESRGFEFSPTGRMPKDLLQPAVPEEHDPMGAFSRVTEEFKALEEAAISTQEQFNLALDALGQFGGILNSLSSIVDDETAESFREIAGLINTFISVWQFFTAVQTVVNAITSTTVAAKTAETGVTIAATVAMTAFTTSVIAATAANSFKLFLPFDDPFNDARLQTVARSKVMKELDRRDNFVDVGINRGLRSNTQQSPNISIGDIIIEGNADRNTIEMLDEWRDKLVKDIKDGFVPEIKYNRVRSKR